MRIKKMRVRKRFRTALVAMAGIAVLSSHSSFARDSAATIGEFNFESDVLVLPLAKNATHPRIVVDVGDGKQYQFIVDTGAGVNVIDSSIAESMDYEMVGEMEIGAPGGSKILGNIVSVPLMKLGGAALERAEFVTMDIIGFSRGSAHGVIGVGVFEDYLLTYDLGGERLTVSRGHLSADDQGVVAYDGSNLQIEIEVDVAGVKVGTHIDTGSMGGLMLPAEMAESLPLKTAPAGKATARLVGSEREVQFAQLDGSVRFAGLEYENQNIAFLNPSSGHGNIGGRILGNLLVSIDQQNDLIRFQKTDRAVAESDDKPRRLGVQFRGMPGGRGLTIAYVEAGSIAEQAGLMLEDVLLSLNGKPTEQYEMSGLRALLGGSEPLTLEIKRGGEVETIEID